jgi:hypothetical protein
MRPAALINVILKLIFQRAWLRRNLADSPNPQYFVAGRVSIFRHAAG